MLLLCIDIFNIPGHHKTFGGNTFVETAWNIENMSETEPLVYRGFIMVENLEIIEE
jgi:hypothetical protein